MWHLNQAGCTVLRVLNFQEPQSYVHHVQHPQAALKSLGNGLINALIDELINVNINWIHLNSSIYV